MANTGPDYSQIITLLQNATLRDEDTSAYKAVKNLIDGLRTFQKLAENNFADTVYSGDLTDKLAPYKPLKIVEYDSNLGATAFELSDYALTDGGLVIFKDIGGVASANNITITGSVEGVTDPVINTDYGTYKVYYSLSDGLYHTW